MSMKEALRRRRGKGVDISIVLGQPNDVQSQMHGDHKPASDEGQETDMAPEVANESEDVKEQSLEGMPVVNGDAVAHPDEEQDLALLAKVLGKSSLLARHMKK